MAKPLLRREEVHPEAEVEERCIPLTVERRDSTLRVGKIWGLDIYRLDLALYE